MMTLNKLLEILREIPNKTNCVYFSFCGCVPTRVDSWRGAYNEPALGWESCHWDNRITVEALIRELEKAISAGQEYTGWKGGQYSYDGTEPLHVDNPGKYTCTEIISVDVPDDGNIIIHTTCDAN